jgi:proline racemase
MISAVGAHACGEPEWVIVGGVPMFEKKVYLEPHCD